MTDIINNKDTNTGIKKMIEIAAALTAWTLAMGLIVKHVKENGAL